MMNQAVGPANTCDILYFTRVLLFIALMSMGYALSRPNDAGKKEQDLLSSDTIQEPAGLPQWQRRASAKAVEKYTESQERKWRRWNEAMFERSS